MRPATEALKDGQWKGHRAFVVGSGPSLKGFDYSLLKGELWIGCNEEYRHGPTIGICQDPRLFAGDGSPERQPLSKDPTWYGGPHLPLHFRGHPDRVDTAAPDTVFEVRTAHSRETPFKWGTSLEGGIYYGANIGMSAINLAEILGADPIYLLGFDARVDDAETHHHDHYPVEWRLAHRDDRQAVYSRWHAEFREIAQVVRARVINLNVNSGIDAFPRWNYAEATDLNGRTSIYPFEMIAPYTSIRVNP